MGYFVGQFHKSLGIWSWLLGLYLTDPDKNAMIIPIFSSQLNPQSLELLQVGSNLFPWCPHNHSPMKLAFFFMANLQFFWLVQLVQGFRGLPHGLCSLLLGFTIGLCELPEVRKRLGVASDALPWAGGAEGAGSQGPRVPGSVLAGRSDTNKGIS